MRSESDSDHTPGKPGDPAPGLHLRILGGFGLTRLHDGAELGVSSKKARALLGYLALARQPTTRDKLTALLWPDSGEEQARGSLRQVLAGLRRLLDADSLPLIATGDGTLALDDGVSVDALQLEDGVRAGDLASLQRVAQLYRGPLLDGLDARADTFEQWLTQERSRLSNLVTTALSDLLALQTEAGELDGACETAMRALACAPLREDIHRAAMRLHQLRGRCTEALQQYARCQQLLAEELGVEPEAATVALRDEIAAQRSDTATPAGPAATAQRLPFAPVREEGKPTVIVLPFDSLSSGAEQAHFADGITEDVITELSRFPDLFVIARNTAFTYKGRGATAEEIRAETGAHYQVSGTVRRAGERVRLTAQLVETGTGKLLWAQRYDRELRDVFELQDELARAIVGVLPGRVREYEAKRIAHHPPEHMAAYELLLAGRVHHHRCTLEDNLRATQLLDRAIEIEPDYAAAWAWKACVLGQAIGRAYQPNPGKLWDDALVCARRGLAIDENEIECHRILAEMAIDRRDLDGARRHNDRALELNPNDPRLVLQRGELLVWSGEGQGAVEAILLAMRLDPYGGADCAHQLGRARVVLGDHAGAIEAYARSTYPRAYHHADMAGCHAALGDDASSRAEVERTLALDPGFSRAAYVEGLPYAHARDREAHRRLLDGTALP